MVIRITWWYELHVVQAAASSRTMSVCVSVYVYSKPEERAEASSRIGTQKHTHTFTANKIHSTAHTQIRHK